jgi:hypothetical protein
MEQMTIPHYIFHTNMNWIRIKSVLYQAVPLIIFMCKKALTLSVI